MKDYRNPSPRALPAAGRRGPICRVTDTPAPPPDAAPDAPPVLALVRDLLFSSRITATAGSVGVPIKVIRDPAKLAGVPGRRLLVDLNLDGAIDAAAAWQAARKAPAFGFVSHVDTPTIQRARAAGIDRVMPRSQFVQVLAELLATP